jgi:hypothetical protein
MLKLLGSFDLDPCAAKDRHWDVAEANYTLDDDGLQKPWKGRVWLNPPFGKGLDKWIAKLAEHGNGLGILPLRSTDANWFHDAIWGTAGAVLFLRGRVRFYTLEGEESGPCPHASLLIAYGARNVASLQKAAREPSRPLFSRGKFIVLGQSSI